MPEAGAFVLAIIALAVTLTVVAPIAIVMHYVTVWRRMRTLSTDDERLLDDLWRTARTLERRVEALETILDKDAPDWRERHGY